MQQLPICTRNQLPSWSMQLDYLCWFWRVHAREETGAHTHLIIIVFEFLFLENLALVFINGNWWQVCMFNVLNPLCLEGYVQMNVAKFIEHLRLL